MRRAAPWSLVALIACSNAPPGEPARSAGDGAPAATGAATAQAVGSAEGAIATFKAAWPARVMPAVPEKDRRMITAVDEEMRRGEHSYSAKLEPCRKGHEVVSKFNATGYDFVFFGRLASLDRDGDCWAVMYQGGMKHEVIGYLEPSSGELLAVWRIPEG